jgi:hypothetical protein
MSEESEELRALRTSTNNFFRFYTKEIRFGRFRFVVEWTNAHAWITVSTRRFIDNCPVVLGPMEIKRDEAVELAALFGLLKGIVPVRPHADYVHLDKEKKEEDE